MRDPLDAVDQIVQEAQQAGQFDDLPGKGKPLKLDPSPDAMDNNRKKGGGGAGEGGERPRESGPLKEEARRPRAALKKKPRPRRAAVPARPPTPPPAPATSPRLHERLRGALS